MDTEQQGLYLMTTISSLLSLFSGTLLLVLCGFANMWKISSIRIITYLIGSNMLGSITLLLPTYRYEFMCSFQGHLLNFSIISQIIWSTLLMHFAYMKIVKNTPFTRMIEIRYLGIALAPALIASLPPFVPENIGNNCWENKHSPIQDAVGSYGFFTLFLLSCFIALVFFLLIIKYLKGFPKGFQTEEYCEKVKKFEFLARFAFLFLAVGAVVFVYACMQIYGVERRSMDFLVMCCYGLAGTILTGMFLFNDKIKRKLKMFLNPNKSEVSILKEDIDGLSYATEQLSHDLSD